MKSYFITGTDTDIGKTLATALLSLYFQNRDFDAFPYKPVQSGAITYDEKLAAPDVLCYAEALPSLDTEEAYTYLLKKPSSPHLAAKEENIQIDLKHIHSQVITLQHKHQLVLVEGAGGIMVPLNENGDSMLTLMNALNLPVILVARAGLGTLNHTLLSIMALQQANIPIAGILLNQLEQDGDETIAADNERMLRKLTDIPVLGVIPHLTNLREAFQDTDKLEPLFKALDNHLLKEEASI